MPVRTIITILLCLILIALLSPVARAENVSLGTATSLAIDEKGIQEGDIIAASTQGYKRSSSAYDPLLFGIVSKIPALYLEDKALKNRYPVVTTGKAYVRVSTVNGVIRKGDLITSSDKPGIGEKALDNGYVLGFAEEEYTEADPNKTGLVLITLNPHFAQLTKNISRNILNGVRLGMTAALLTPLGAFRYAASAVIAILSFYFGFRFLGKTSRMGVEAIGRNPLATKAILFGIAANVTVTIAIMFFGVALAYIILVL